MVQYGGPAARRNRTSHPPCTIACSCEEMDGRITITSNHVLDSHCQRIRSSEMHGCLRSLRNERFVAAAIHTDGTNKIDHRFTIAQRIPNRLHLSHEHPPFHGHKPRLAVGG